MNDYHTFLASKQRRHADTGIDIDPDDLHPSLFAFQRDLVTWAARKGRSAIWADTGLGKTRMQLEWARVLGQRTLILAPLAVAQQTINEAAGLGIDVDYARHQDEATTTISITNYERLDRFDPAAFGAVVLDESSILKAFSGVTKKALVAAFDKTPYRLACTATPAPNDIEELCNHADFLGVMKPNEMRSTFFIAEDRARFMKYRLKRHAREAFYRWLASWATAVRHPRDYGYTDQRYDLPPLNIRPHFVESEWTPDGQLFSVDLPSAAELGHIRRETLAERADRAQQIIDAEPGEQWLIWTGLNDEADEMTRRISGAVNVQGSDTAEHKAETLMAFANNDLRVLVTKPSIAGFGMNFQSCARQLFIGIGYSYESYYQSIRRSWRFGQTRPVDVHLVLSTNEKQVYELVADKERRAGELAEGLVAGMHDHSMLELFEGTSKGDSFDPTEPADIPAWLTTKEAA